MFTWGGYWHSLSAAHVPLMLAVTLIILAGYAGQEWARDRGATDFNAPPGENLPYTVRAVDTDSVGGAARPVTGDPAGVQRAAPAPKDSLWETLP
jgi:hypothetical protein